MDGPEIESKAAEPVSAFQLVNRSDPHSGDDVRDEQRDAQATRQVTESDFLRFCSFDGLCLGARPGMNGSQLSWRSKMTANVGNVSGSCQRQRATGLAAMPKSVTETGRSVPGPKQVIRWADAYDRFPPQTRHSG